MDLNRHEFELDDLIERIKDNDNRLVALQVPEGLKMQALEMMDTIETETSAQVVLAADPCYGACDLVHDKMQLMGVELVAHMGHSQMNIDSGMPTQFINVTYDGDPELSPVLPWLNQHRGLRRPPCPVQEMTQASATICSLGAGISTRLDSSYIPENLLPCWTLTPAMLKKCHSNALNEFFVNASVSS